MTVTKNDTCTELTLTSTQITALATADTATVYYKVNNATEASFTITSADVTNSTITITPTTLGQGGTTFNDGVYCFRLVVTVDSTSVTTTEYDSILIDCGLKCTLSTKIWNEPEKMLHSKHRAIELFLDCKSCDCSTAYNLYQDLICELGLSTSPCGC